MRYMLTLRVSDQTPLIVAKTVVQNVAKAIRLAKDCPTGGEIEVSLKYDGRDVIFTGELVL